MPMKHRGDEPGDHVESEAEREEREVERLGGWDAISERGKRAHEAQVAQLESLVTLVDVARMWNPSMPLPAEGESSPEELNSRARERLLAALAGRHARVREFRNGVLGEELLTPDQVPLWAHNMAVLERPPSMRVSYTVPQTEIEVAADGETYEVAPHRGLTRELRADRLYYLDGSGKVEYVEIAAGKVLDSLRALAKHLALACGWHPAQATNFVLTGWVPEIRGVLHSEPDPEFSEAPAVSRIVLHVAPTVSPRALMEEYSRLRQRYFRARVPVLERKSLLLALETVEAEPDESWERKRANWNTRHPEWAYEDVRNFARAATLSQMRLRGIDVKKGEM